jgi:hypothetical protein
MWGLIHCSARKKQSISTIVDLSTTAMPYIHCLIELSVYSAMLTGLRYHLLLHNHHRHRQLKALTLLQIIRYVIFPFREDLFNY